MKSTILVLFLILPAIGLSQTLSEVAKKEKERRDKNKQQGKQAQVVSENDLKAAKGSSPEIEGIAQPGPSEGASRPVSETSSSGPSPSESEGEEDTNVPTSISSDLPMDQRLAVFERMKRQYARQVEEIDKAIAKNNARLKEIETELAATAGLGGNGLPVAPQTGTGAATRPMTGQESTALVGEQERLKAMNEQMSGRKAQLKLDLQAKGRAANIPVGNLRF